MRVIISKESEFFRREIHLRLMKVKKNAATCEGKIKFVAKDQ